MKNSLCLILLIISIYDAKAQKDYQLKYKLAMKPLLEMSFSDGSTECFIISLSPELEMVSYIVHIENSTIKPTKAKAFKAASCEECDLIKKKKVSDPVDFVYSNFEESRVYMISKKKDDYLVEIYGDD